MRFCFYFALFSCLVINILADPMILDLKSYKNGTVYQVANLEDSANLYVASDDDPSNLRLIQIITGGNTYS